LANSKAMYLQVKQLNNYMYMYCKQMHIKHYVSTIFHDKIKLYNYLRMHGKFQVSKMPR